MKALLDVRRQTARDWLAGTFSLYADSDLRVWYWPCPHCGRWSSPAPIAARHMAIQYPEQGTLDEIEQ